MTKTFISDLSGKTFPVVEKISAESIRRPLMVLIQQDHPEFDHTKYLAFSELDSYRERYVADYVGRQVGELSDLEKKVLNSMKSHSMVCCSGKGYKEPTPTMSQRIADGINRFCGSWKFFASFLVILVLWVGLNVFWVTHRRFDPYPFVLLNLLLSWLSTLQAPLIMMSQNRQSDKDRQRSKDDYMVNLKSEIEVRTLHEKVDHLMMYQQQDMIETQNIQIDMLTELTQTLKRNLDKERREHKTLREA